MIMLLRTFVIFAVKFSCVFSYVYIDNGVYNGISVGLHKSLQSKDCQGIVDSVKKMFVSASDVLSNATSGLLFGSVIVVVPNSWSTCGTYSLNNADGYLTYNTTTLRIGGLHPLFGEEPWTNQPSGCGTQGEFISMSSNWLNSSAFSDTQKGTRLVHEWAKYRWGVFEEYGHYEDQVYPESYRQTNGSWAPNYCTNSKLNGQFSSSCSSSMDCKFNVENSPSASSSLMSVPKLPSMTSFCDDNNHRYDIPSKQNIICNYTSVWSVISKHSDITQKRFRKPTSKSIEITVLRESFSNSLVIAYETSLAMEDFINRFEFLKESISQFLVYEAPDSAKVGLVSFSTIAVLQTPALQVLDPNSRKSIANKVLGTLINANNDFNLQDALQTSASLLTQGNGIILLFTRCTGQDPKITTTELVAAANGHPVWIILYPTNSTLFLNVYSDLASLTGGKLIVIQEIVKDGGDEQGIYVDTSIRMDLSQSIRQLLHQEPAFDFQQITYQNCTGRSCDQTITSSSGFQNPMFVNVYHDLVDDVNEPDSVVTVTGGSCSSDNISKLVVTTNVFKCSSSDLTPKFSVQVSLKKSLQTHIIELVGRPVIAKSDFKIQLVGSANLYGVQYTENSAPAIYVQLSSNEINIVYANVSATLSSNLLGRSTMQIDLRDDGTGADITGNDGIYSAFLLPSLPVGDFSISFTANNNNGQAKFLPATYDSKRSYVCCGSVIPLPSDLSSTQSFSISSRSIMGTVTESPDNLNLPPGVIKDFQYTSDGDGNILVSFTATGEDLTYGTADHYVLRIYQNNLRDYTEKELSYTPEPSGSLETHEETSLSCGSTYTVSIFAVDKAGLRGSESNRITVYVSCLKSGGISAGAWVGIAFAILFVLIIFIGFIVYIMFYEDNSNDKKGMQKLKTCSCCEKEDEHENYYNDATYPSRVDDDYMTTDRDYSPPVQQIRSLKELVVSQEGEIELKEGGRPLDVHQVETLEHNQYEMMPPHVLEDITYLAKLSHKKRTDSERSLESAQTASPFVSTHSMNKVGVPYSSPTSSISDYRTIPMGKSNDSLYNTQV